MFSFLYFIWLKSPSKLRSVYSAVNQLLLAIVRKIFKSNGKIFKGAALFRVPRTDGGVTPGCHMCHCVMLPWCHNVSLGTATRCPGPFVNSLVKYCPRQESILQHMSPSISHRLCCGNPGPGPRLLSSAQKYLSTSEEKKVDNILHSPFHQPHYQHNFLQIY